MKEASSSRRVWLQRGLFAAAGAVLGVGAGPAINLLRRASGVRGKPAAKAGSEPRPSVVLSLAVLQERARTLSASGTPLTPEIAHLGGINRFHGFLLEEDQEVLLLGDRVPAWPPVHIDDLMVALRSGFAVSEVYREAPGCSIDPPEDAPDRWAIQNVRVLGMPADCRMAARHVAIDYELKKAGAGIVLLGDGVRGSFEQHLDERPLCAEGSPKTRSVTHRFWFCPLYPDAPRFVAEDAPEGAVMIRRPVKVQVLTERRLFGPKGKEAGAEPPDPAAEQFARDVTRLLGGDTRREYVGLRNDFRVIELGRLLRFGNTPAASLAYLLEEHGPEKVEVPRFVVGIRRSEKREVVCGGKITERLARVESSAKVREMISTYRGGVEARVETPPTHFAHDARGPIRELRQKVRRSRPSSGVMAWPLSER